MTMPTSPIKQVIFKKSTISQGGKIKTTGERSISTFEKECELQSKWIRFILQQSSPAG
jgi:hypothetical protein